MDSFLKMRAIFRHMFLLLSPTERKQAYACFGAMLMMAFVEVIGVASLMPFIAVLADPDAVSHHPKLNLIYQQLHFTNYHYFLIFLGVLVLGILIIGNVISLLTTWAIFKFTYAREYSLSKRLFTHYLSQPYLFFLNRNPSELSKNILSEVMTIINRAFIPGMQLIAKSIVAILILLLLLVVDPMLAFVISFIFGGAYASIYLKVRKKLSVISKRCLADNQQKYKIVTESLMGIKDIKLLGRENYFIEAFSTYAKQHAEDGAASHLIAHIPRYALETIAFGGVLVIILYLLIMHKNINDALPLLALYAFASLRLMPALQQIFTSLAFLRVSKEALAVITHDLQTEKIILPVSANGSFSNHANASFAFNQTIELQQVSFTYPSSIKPILHQLNMKIPAYTTVGFVGMTGAGKTTLVDIILGLLKCTEGNICIDGLLISEENIHQWQKKIGYVPQNIYLSDESITKNIAFGIAEDAINKENVEKAAKLANIHDFVVDELEKRYETIIGDRGVRLSGGQRQRIGIARALYHDPQILVMDEATNALDNVTESIIMDAVTSFGKSKTLIIVAHKLATLSACDQIFVFAKGQLQAIGKYHELLKKDKTFRTLAGLELQGTVYE